MNPAEQVARAALTTAAVYDHRFREPDPLVARAWATALAGLDADGVIAAVNEHYRTSTDTLMPGHVTALVQRVGGHPDRHPSARTPTEALASTLGGRGDVLAGDRSDPPFVLDGPAPRSGAEALTAAQAWAASNPTGYERRRNPPAGRTAADRSRELGRQQRENGARVIDGRTDAQRADAGRAVTICHGCAGDIPAPPGWDPANPDSPPLHCARCRPEQAREAS